MASFCGSCGKELAPGVKFCGSCGAVIDQAAQAGPDAGYGDAVQGQAQQANYNAGPGQPQANYNPGPGQPQGYGQAPDAGGQKTSQPFDNIMKMAQNTADHTADYATDDIEKNKTMAGLAYFLFFLPLVACPDSKFGRYHANQGLLFLILWVAGWIVTSIIRVILRYVPFLPSLISLIIYIPILAIGILGLINGFSGKAKDLPLIGHLRIIN